METSKIPTFYVEAWWGNRLQKSGYLQMSCSADEVHDYIMRAERAQLVIVKEVF